MPAGAVSAPDTNFICQWIFAIVCLSMPPVYARGEAEETGAPPANNFILIAVDCRLKPREHSVRNTKSGEFNMTLEQFITLYAGAKSGEIYSPDILTEAKIFAQNQAEIAAEAEKAEVWQNFAKWLETEIIENGE